MTKKLIAFHGNAQLKEKYIKRLEAHYAADEFVQGKYWENGKGCQWGCTLHSNDPHPLVEDTLGIPRVLSKLSDRLFEGMEPCQVEAWDGLKRNIYGYLPEGLDSDHKCEFCGETEGDAYYAREQILCSEHA